MQRDSSVPISVLVYYGIGICGLWLIWQALLFFLVNFYIPPTGDGLPIFIYQGKIFLFVNAIAIISFVTRLFDFITDPIIGNLIDKHKGKKGGRFSFLKIGSLSALLFVLIFLPIHNYPSPINAAWLLFTLTIFYLVFTCYFIPYFTLMVDISKSNGDRVNFATSVGVAISLSLVMSAQVPLLWELFQSHGFTVLQSRQLGFVVLGVIAFVMMLVPIFTLPDTSNLSKNAAVLNLKDAMKYISKNRYFRPYFICVLFYYIANAIFVAGVPYLITVLLDLNATQIAKVAPIIFLSSISVYPLINVLAKTIGKKLLFFIAMIMYSIGFAAASYLGKYSASSLMQAYTIAAYFGVAAGIMSIILSAMCADIAEHSKKCLGVVSEAAFFAGKNMALKLGAVIGVSTFAAFTLLGKDVGHDLGLRAINMLSSAICFIGAMLVLTLYSEKKLFQELQHAGGS